MRLTITTVFLVGGGVLLIWSGITDRNPVEVLRSIFTDQPIPEKGSWSGASGPVESGGVSV